jgi:hypothetical protein
VAGVGERWSVERVMAAAPDSASAVSGRKLAGPGPWVEVGADGPVIWGRCRGSSREAYRVVVDTAAPRYQCSCPSRKFPCKHALGLLFRWAEERFPDDPQRPAYARSGGPDAGGAGRQPAGEPAAGGAKTEAAAARAAERIDRVGAGLADLERWIGDVVSGGLGQLAADPEQFEQQAARMIDAQAPGVARWLRRLREIPPGSSDWAARVLADLAMLRLLREAFDRRDALDPELLATVRSHLGFTVGKAEVLARPAVADRWVVVGLHDTQDDERIATRRVWLFGLHTERFAVVLLFSVNGAPYEMTLAPGMELDADLHFYPGRPALRALVGERRGERDRVEELRPAARSIAEARDDWAAAIAADPWLTLWPVVLRGALLVSEDAVTEGSRGSFFLVDPAGATLPVVGPEPLVWQGLALTGATEFTWFGELSPQGFSPLAGVDAVHSRGKLIVL